MTLFNQKRLTNDLFKLDVDRMRQGWYSDKYYANILKLLTGVGQMGGYQGEFSLPVEFDVRGLDVGEMDVEVQFFTRRAGKTVIVGVDKALSMLRHCAGYFSAEGVWISTWDNLRVTAVHDGAVTTFDGNPMRIQPVIKISGRYRDFAILETPMLGILSRSSRIATNVYNVLKAVRNKPVLFFPARFDMHEVQAADGYAYDIGVARFNLDFGERLGSYVSTDAQGDWWGGAGGGTIAHAAIACFFGDTAAAMLAFAEHVPPEVLRIALVDFNNDSVTDALRTLRVMFDRYLECVEKDDQTAAQKYILYGVRLDTSSSLRDVNVPPLGEPQLDLGVTPRLVFFVRQALDNAYTNWQLSSAQMKMAKKYCRDVRIVVTGGFNPEKILNFEKLRVPVDIYGVGSSLLTNDKTTNNDFTADVVRVKVGGEWRNMAKVGRHPCDNPDLEPVNLTLL